MGQKVFHFISILIFFFIGKADLFDCRFWDQYYPGGTYDPKVKQTPIKKTASSAKLSTSHSTLKKSLSGADVAEKPRVKPLRSGQAAAAAGPNTARDLIDEYQKVAADLTAQVRFISFSSIGIVVFFDIIGIHPIEN
jgi:hypothetical protein